MSMRRARLASDMGGTTAKASLIENGEFTRATEYQVGAGIVLGSRLLSGAGYTLKVPAIDLAEVGAGGGSILWIDSGGALQIGPHSAGADPGPVCYDIGGIEPTVTDASVILGYINPNHLVGGALKLNAAKSREAIEHKIARPLSMLAVVIGVVGGVALGLIAGFYSGGWLEQVIMPCSTRWRRSRC